jgi:uncharacterized protein involved in outer membrane biogenesis
MTFSRRLAITTASIAAAIAAVLIGLALGVPAAVRWGIETVAARETGRVWQVGTIRFNPLTLRLEVRDLSIGGAADEKLPLLTLAELRTQLGASSIWPLAPVVRSLRLQGLRTNVVRLAPNRFNFSDIVERLAAKPGTGEPARFAVNNIELADGAIDIDDRVVGRRHAVTELAIGIPFISSLPDDEDIQVKPVVAARVNGAPFRLEGETLPFADSLETSLSFRASGLQLPTYLGYAPVPLRFSVPRGELDTDLRLVFRRAVAARADRPAQPARLLLTGRAAIRDFALQPQDMDEPLVEWRALEIVLDEVGLLARSAKVASVTLNAPVLRATRRADGSLAGLAAFGANAPVAAVPADAGQSTGAPAGSAAPFVVRVAKARASDGIVHFRDESVDFARTLQALAVEIDQFTSSADAPARLSAAARTDDGTRLKLAGELRAAPLQLGLDATIDGLPLAGLAPYLRPIIRAAVDGTVEVGARITAAQSGDDFDLKVTNGRLSGSALRLRGPAGNAAQLALARLEVAGIGLDLLQRDVQIERASVAGLRAWATRDADGRFDWQKLIVESAPAAAAARGPPWKVHLAEVEVVNARALATDIAVQPPVKVAVEGLNAVIRNAGSDLGARMAIQLRTRLGGGSAQARGWLRVQPMAGELKLDVANVDVSALRPYAARYANAVLASAAVWSNGTLAFGMAKDAPAIRFDGGARLTNFAALNPDGETELARWQALALDAVRLDTGAQPPYVDIGSVKLNDFYARAILSEQGKLNLVEVFRSPAAAESTDDSAATAPAASTSPAGAAAAQPMRIRIGATEIQRGNINFTDNFIKPNYTANLTDLVGTVSEFVSDRAELADVSVRGRVDGDAPVEITGKVNPLAEPLALDLRGTTQGVELPRLTPYSAKYAGYPITRGKLSMDVQYKIENNRLQAENHLFLDQLTFGERVDSPSATKLPVLLAVALLKNSRGEIDIRLPISGSLDDPEFSIGGIIVQVIVNLLTKIVTAPFSLLAAAFGGGPDLGHIEFAPGSALLTEVQVRKLETLAKALLDRPALRLDMTGRALAAVDTGALRRAKLDGKLRAAKLRELVRAGGSADPATITVAAEERERLLARVYADEKIPEKPRNVLGIAKAIPAAEMERLILGTLTVTEDDLRRLANDRATAVRDHLSEQGKVPRERLFLVAPLLDGSGDAKMPPARVDFSLK